jgi:hypothetical protein
MYECVLPNSSIMYLQIVMTKIPSKVFRLQIKKSLLYLVFDLFEGAKR